MTRYRPIAAATCLAALLFAALPTSGAAQRDAQQLSVSARAEFVGEGLFGSIWSWGQVALGWLQAIVAPEHGQIAESPVVPPPTTP